MRIESFGSLGRGETAKEFREEGCKYEGAAEGEGKLAHGAWHGCCARRLGCAQKLYAWRKMGMS